MIKEEELALSFLEAYVDYQQLLSDIFSLIGNELVNLRCAILVIKGYSKDYRIQEDNDIEMAFNEEIITYKESLLTIKNKLISLKPFIEKFISKKHNLETVKMPSEKTKSLLQLFENTKDAIIELIRQLEDSFLKKQFANYEKIVTGGIHPAIASLEEINNIYSDTLNNIASGIKIDKEGMRIKNLIKTSLDEIKLRYFTDENQEPQDKKEDIEEENLNEIIEIIKDGVENIEEQVFDPSLPVVDGDIQVKTTREGIFIKIIPPSNGGMSITLSELKSVIKGNKIPMLDDKRLQEIISSKPNDFIKINDWQPNQKLDANIRIIFKNDKIEAYINVKAPRFSGKSVDEEDFREVFSKNNIKFGIVEDNVKRFVRTPIYNKEILIAEGTKPVKGENAKFIYHFKTEIKKKPTVDSKGNVDHKQLNIIQNIEPDTLLIEKISAKPGILGKNVCGEDIPALYGDDSEIRIIKGAEYRENGAKIYSTVLGHPILRNNELEVSPIYAVDNNVDYETGNIVFDGSVIVKGDIADEFTIQARDDVEIIGNVYKSTIIAGGNIVLQQGINGRGEGKLIAGKSIISRYIENSNVEAKEDVIVTNNILHSNVKAGRSVRCLGKGIIAGGKIICKNSVECKVLGSNANVNTVLEIGIDDFLKEKQNQVAMDMYKVKNYIEKAKRLMEKIKPKADVNNRIYMRWLNIRSASNDKLKELEKMKLKLEEIANLMFEVVKNAYILSELTYPNIEIRIIKLTKKISKVINFPHKLHFIEKDKDIGFTKVDVVNDSEPNSDSIY